MPAETVAYVTGTGTGIGKTWAAAALARTLRNAGRTVRACKPVQSHDPADTVLTDADVLADATGQRACDVCSPERTYPVPLAPPMAARKLGRTCPGSDELARICYFGDDVDVGIVEGVGGLYSPLAVDGHNLNLIERIEPDLVLVVASATLGAIHDTIACTVALAAHRLMVLLNRFDPDVEVHNLNLDWLRDQGLTVMTSVPTLADHI